MPGTSLEHAIPQLEKLKKNIKKIPFKFKDKQIEITVSLGATQFKQGDTLLKAFDRADDALNTKPKTQVGIVCVYVNNVI